MTAVPDSLADAAVTPAPRRSLGRDVVAFVRDIKLEHSLFALPFALLGALLACQAGLSANARGLPYPGKKELLLLVVAMVAARSAAMGFNRLVDRRLDADNPRTAGRALAAGRARAVSYALLIVLGAVLLWWVAGRFNPMSRRLVPVVLLVLFGYSYTKRFTVLCHWFLGLALGLAPLAAWVALCGGPPRSPAPWLLFALVVLWVAGFDILYATMDVEFDRAHGLRSIPAWLGIPRALWVARACHLGTALCLVAFYLLTPGLNLGFGAAVVLALALLGYEHALVRPDNLQRVNTAFFTVNAVLGAILLAGAWVDWVVRGCT